METSLFVVDKLTVEDDLRFKILDVSTWTPKGREVKLQIRVDLKPGKYRFYCSVPGHEQAGMKIDVTVS